MVLSIQNIFFLFSSGFPWPQQHHTQNIYSLPLLIIILITKLGQLCHHNLQNVYLDIQPIRGSTQELNNISSSSLNDILAFTTWSWSHQNNLQGSGYRLAHPHCSTKRTSYPNTTHRCKAPL